MYNGGYDSLSIKCKKIINDNTPQECVKKIANLKNPNNGEKIGRDDALKIYTLYAEESVKYTEKKYGNNITLYKKKINKNIEIIKI